MNEEYNEDVDTSENNEDSEEETQEDETSQDEENSPSLEDFKTLQEKTRELEEKNKHLYARIKKSEQKNLKTNTMGLTKDEAILYAKGHTEDEVEMAAKLATINNTSILEAMKDELIVSKIEARKKKEQTDNASLPPSSGSPVIKPPKPVGEMTEEEHREYARKLLNQS